MASTSRVVMSVGHCTSRSSSPSSGVARAEIQCSSRNPSLSWRTLMVNRKLSSERLRRTKPSSCSVSSSRRTVVRCRPLNSASRPGVAPPSNLFNNFNNNKPRLNPRTVLYSVDPSSRINPSLKCFINSVVHLVHIRRCFDCSRKPPPYTQPIIKIRLHMINKLPVSRAVSES